MSPEALKALRSLFLPTVLGGAAGGLVFGLVRQLRHKLTRLMLLLAIASGLVALGLASLNLLDIKLPFQVAHLDVRNTTAFAIQLLLGIPFFYVLTFAGHEEESEVEIAAMCGLLGLGLGILVEGNKQLSSLAFLMPIVLYFGYTIRVLPGLRVLKHAFRGMSYARVGRHRRALQAFRRALQLDPNNRLAREGFWEVHCSLDLDQLQNDPQTLALVDLDLCLDRAGTLLLSKPSETQLAEAQSLLALVSKLAPGREPAVDYWRAVALTHQHNIDQAASHLLRVIDPEVYGMDNIHRRNVLLPTWQLALLLHEGLRQRVGQPQLAVPGRRMEAIYVVERHLASNPDDPGVIPLKRLLYQDLTEAEYDAGAGEGLAAPYIDHAYLQQLGVSLIDDEVRWHRGGEYLRLAARGLPALGPTLFLQIAQAQQRVGLITEARHNYELAKRAGQGVGPSNLAAAEQQAYFATVKFLGEEAMHRGDTDGAIENFRLYSESPQSGIETLRALAELYKRKGNVLAAARVVDQGLQFNSRDADLLQRKDDYYYSIDPEDLKAHLEHYGRGFDVAYCIQKSRQALDQYTDLVWVDVAQQLTKLALVVQPENRLAKWMLARVHLRLGERDRAVSILEEVRGPQRPEAFASGEDEEAWYLASQLLGDLYLELGRADLAVPCLNDFRKSSKSGAKTLFKLGQAFEQLGDPKRAAKCYEQVAAYDGNPLVPDAQEALERLRG
jgi:tetratricopeptide (TPR) repeat protein